MFKMLGLSTLETFFVIKIQKDLYLRYMFGLAILRCEIQIALSHKDFLSLVVLGLFLVPGPAML